MTKITIASNAGNLMERGFEGLWWTPENDSLRIPGNLTFDCDQGGTLILHGGLFSDDAPSIWPVILGTSKDVPITILDARWRGNEGQQRWLNNGTKDME
jgi:hypothetical protein